MAFRHPAFRAALTLGVALAATIGVAALAWQPPEPEVSVAPPTLPAPTGR